MRLLKLKTIVTATDLDESSQAAVGTAHRLARASGAALHVVHVVGDVDDDGLPVDAEGAAGAVRELLHVAGIADDDAKVHVIPGLTAGAIGDLAQRVDADVIVVGPHRERDSVTGGYTLGGTARAIVEHANAPCLVTGSDLRLPLERVLVPTDLSDTARGALLVALSWASALRIGGKDGRQTCLTALQVVPESADTDVAGAAPALAKELRSVQDGMGSWAGIAVDGHTTHGDDVAKAIGRYAAERGADLVVIGTRGRGVDEEARLGSVSAEVTLHVGVPTLLVPPAVWRERARSS